MFCSYRNVFATLFQMKISGVLLKKKTWLGLVAYCCLFVFISVQAIKIFHTHNNHAVPTASSKVLLSEKCAVCDLLGHTQPANLVDFQLFQLDKPQLPFIKLMMRVFTQFIKPLLYSCINRGPPANL